MIDLGKYDEAKKVFEQAQTIVDKKKGKRSPTEKKRFDRQQQKEIVRQLTAELIKISKKDMLDEAPKEIKNKSTNDVIYTIKPVNYDE